MYFLFVVIDTFKTFPILSIHVCLFSRYLKIFPLTQQS